MPFTIKFDNTYVGYAAKSKKKGEDTVQVLPMGYTTSEDGEIFFKYLDGLSSAVLSKLPNRNNLKESIIDNLLVLITEEGTATVYINELNFIVELMAKRGVRTGEAVFEDDIADIINPAIIWGNHAA